MWPTVFQLFASRGDSRYGGEAVTQREHALQAATLALHEQADAELIAASLLHDVGHLLHRLPENAPEFAIEDRHEELGYRWLSKFFGPGVTEPVRLHVASKRYLCAREAGYWEALSLPSRRSLELQGGAFSPREADEFERGPYFQAALRLRRWDDCGKVAGLHTESLEFFRPFLERAVQAQGRNPACES